MRKPTVCTSTTLALTLAWLSPSAHAAPVSASPTVLFTHVRIFDGTSSTLVTGKQVLVRGSVIADVSATPSLAPGEAVQVIDGKDGVLMPGMIDAHIHTMLSASSYYSLQDPWLLGLEAGKAATETLMRGFTSVRDMGGASFGLKRAIDQGTIDGPRIWPSGAIISQTGGHGDFRGLNELPRTPLNPLSDMERQGHCAVVDGAENVLRATREQLMKGASQVKLSAGGGVVSAYDTLDTSQFTVEELRAAVDAATDYNTYVAVHAYTPRSIQKAVTAGVKCIEHGQLLDEPTARLLAERGTWLCLQPFLNTDGVVGAQSVAKMETVVKGTNLAYGYARKYHIKTAFGTDVILSPAEARKVNQMVVDLKNWFTPAEVLKLVTHDNAELLALAGTRSPYPGPLGVIRKGALADMLVVKGNPLEDLTLLAKPDTSLRLIMKGGLIYKNSL